MDMVLKVFDVAHGSANFLTSPTGRTELVDLGARADWSPLLHIYSTCIPYGRQLDRLVLTHHHGDHLDDVHNLPNRMPSLVVRRGLNGIYAQACRESNSPGGQGKAEYFDSLFGGYIYENPAIQTVEAWGIAISSWILTEQQANSVTSSWNSMTNCCSFVRLYEHNGTKFLLCGDMEKEGMAELLATNAEMRGAVQGVNVLVAPHHAHRSGFSTELMRAIGGPEIVIASMMSGDEHVDSRYSDSDWVRGVNWPGGRVTRLLTTRSNGAITVASHGQDYFQIAVNQR